jgi:1-acyl-sn-glycerol-3-phosphate acyltransferase
LDPLDLLSRFVAPDVAARVARLELPWGSHGIDPYGISKRHLEVFYSVLRLLYRRYFRVRVHDIRRVPARGRAMLVSNHSGGIAFDAAMLATATLLEMEPPRLAHGMAEKFLNTVPVASEWLNRVGHFTGLPEHAVRLLEDDRLLIDFPEGARGTAKLFRERKSLVAFGTGFMRLALQTCTPVMPVAILGAGEALPTVANLYRLGRLVGAPYLPVTPWILPLPLPVRFDIWFGEPMRFEGKGTEEDEVIGRYVQQVRLRIASMIEKGEAAR